MPQLDFAVFLPQIFWLIIFFGLFFVISSFFILPVFSKIKNTRENIINSNLQNAEANNKKILDIENQIEQLKVDTNKKITQAIELAEKKSLLQMQEAIKALDGDFRKNLTKINENLNQTLANISNSTGEIIEKTANKIISNLKS